MGEMEKPTETGAGQGDQADRQRSHAMLSGFYVLESGLSHLLRAGIDRVNLQRLMAAAVATAMDAPGPAATDEELWAYRDVLLAGILALQSTDDLGHELNEQLWQDQSTLQLRLKLVDAQLDPNAPGPRASAAAALVAASPSRSRDP